MITLTIIDIFLILFLLFLFTLGFVYGLVVSLGRVVSLIVGIWGAYQYTPLIGAWLAAKYSWTGIEVVTIGLFFLVGGIIMKLTQLIFYVFDRILDLISFVPFLGFFNRILGGVLVFAIGSFTLGIIVQIILETGFNFFNIEGVSEDSYVLPKLVHMGSFIKPIIPNIISSIWNFF